MKNSYTQNNIEHPVKEIYKSVHGISPPVVKKETTREITLKETPCNLRNFRFLYIDNKKSLHLQPKLLHTDAHRYFRKIHRKTTVPEFLFLPATY